MIPKPRRQAWNAVEKIALAAFIFWSAAGLIFIFGHITPDVIARWPAPNFLRDFVDGCVRFGDPALIFLAFINTHMHAARQWSPGLARRWGLTILVCAFGIEALGAHTGFPFGAYHYTGSFGPMWLDVPLTIPLAWHVVVTNALFLVRALAPYLSRLAEAALAGLLCTAYDFILEPFATTVKRYWIWNQVSVPPLNYVAWFILSALLVRLFAPMLSTRYRTDPRPAMILLLTVLIFIAGELMR